MNKEKDRNSATPNEVNLKAYQSPNLTDYGKMSELTQALSGTVGCDGAYPSYTASF